MKLEIVELPNGKYAVRRKKGFLFFSYYEYRGHTYWHKDNKSIIVIQFYCSLNSIEEAQERCSELMEPPKKQIIYITTN